VTNTTKLSISTSQLFRSVEREEMAELLADPLPTTVPEVLDRLDGLQALAERAPRGQADGLACFNYLYRVITQEVQDRLTEGGTFDDAEFLIRLDVEFAARYFTSVRADAAGTPVPRSWRVLFERRGDPDIDPMRFAITGVNAHVNWDLAFALLSTCEVLDRSFGAAERAEYDAINDIFAEHMSGLRQHFENRFEQLLDRLVFDDLADDAGDLTVLLARDAAWSRAKHLATLRGQPAFDRESAAIDWRASMLGRAMLTFGVL
jgi:hypothetical protein